MDNDPRVIEEDVPLERGKYLHVIGRMEGVRLNIDVYSAPAGMDSARLAEQAEITRDNARQLRNTLNRFINDVSYGDWSMLDNGKSGGGSLSYAVGMQLAGHEDQYNVVAIYDEYKRAIAKALPEGFTLERGREFVGPLSDPWDPKSAIMYIRAAVRSVDFWAIAENHRKDG